jgi:hypothetical protein
MKRKKEASAVKSMGAIVKLKLRGRGVARGVRLNYSPTPRPRRDRSIELSQESHSRPRPDLSIPRDAVSSTVYGSNKPEVRRSRGFSQAAPRTARENMIADHISSNSRQFPATGRIRPRLARPANKLFSSRATRLRQSPRARAYPGCASPRCSVAPVQRRRRGTSSVGRSVYRPLSHPLAPFPPRSIASRSRQFHFSIRPADSRLPTPLPRSPSTPAAPDAVRAATRRRKRYRRDY